MTLRTYHTDLDMDEILDLVAELLEEFYGTEDDEYPHATIYHNGEIVSGPVDDVLLTKIRNLKDALGVDE